MDLSALVKSRDIYTSDNLIVAPHPSERILEDAYMCMATDKIALPDGPLLSILDVIWYENGRPSFRWFLDWFSNPDNNVYGCYERTSSTDMTLRGLGWINSIQNMGACRRKGEIGFGFLNRGSVFSKLRLGAIMLEYIFDILDLDVLFGTTPEQNLFSRMYAKKLGFDMCGPIKSYTTWRGSVTDAWVTSLTQQSWRSINKPKSNQQAAVSKGVI